MIKASILAAVAALVLFALRLGASLPFSVVLPIALLGLSVALALSRIMSHYLKVFVGMLAVAEFILAGLQLADSAGLITGDLKGYVPPASMTIGATIFAFVIYGVSRIPVIGAIMQIADRYFTSP